MNIADFDFNLPPELIAQYPCTPRSASRLLCLDKNTGEITHRIFNELPELLSANDLLIFNNTKVIPARLFGVKLTGGKVELLIERILDEHRILAHIKSNKTLKIGTELIFVNKYNAVIIQRHDDLFELRFNNNESVYSIIEKIGHIPLPPYINRADETFDQERYQTVFAERLGAVAAPTAGLHFDSELLNKIKEKGIGIGYVTLHVGSGTFQPIRVENIHEHKMHSEYFEVSPYLCEQITNTKQRGGRVIAVGTTSVRSLEAAAKSGKLLPFQGDTDIFIYPGYSFKCVDAMITNFHLPKSTLLLLICAFAGYENIMRAYKEAIAQAYRFFSYGDAMFIM
jgi:S-adenosylmethionine:tRNA ribosyltransferase-isomerase